MAKKEIREKVFLLRTKAMGNEEVLKVFATVENDKRCYYILHDLNKISQVMLDRYNQIIQESDMSDEDKKQLFIVTTRK